MRNHSNANCNSVNSTPHTPAISRISKRNDTPAQPGGVILSEIVCIEYSHSVRSAPVHRQCAIGNYSVFFRFLFEALESGELANQSSYYSPPTPDLLLHLSASRVTNHHKSISLRIKALCEFPKLHPHYHYLHIQNRHCHSHLPEVRVLHLV